MEWEKLFKDYPIEWTKYAMMGMCETLTAMLKVLEITKSKEEFKKVLTHTLDNLTKDLNQVMDKE